MVFPCRPHSGTPFSAHALGSELIEPWNPAPVPPDGDDPVITVFDDLHFPNRPDGITSQDAVGRPKGHTRCTDPLRVDVAEYTAAARIVPQHYCTARRITGRMGCPRFDGHSV